MDNGLNKTQNNELNDLILGIIDKLSLSGLTLERVIFDGILDRRHLCFRVDVKTDEPIPDSHMIDDCCPYDPYDGWPEDIPVDFSDDDGNGDDDFFFS